MQTYDLLMLAVLAMATILGAIKGFAWQVASLASIVVSYIVAYRYRLQVAEYIDAQPPWNQFLAMLILYIGTSFAIWVGFRMLSGLIDRMRMKEFDRHLGAVFGFVKGLVYCMLITMFAVTLLGPKQQEAICRSRSGYFISKALDKGAGLLPEEIHNVIGPYLARIDERLDHDDHEHDQWGGLVDSSGAASTTDGDRSSNSWWGSDALNELMKVPGADDQLRQSLKEMQIPETLFENGDQTNTDSAIPPIVSPPPILPPMSRSSDVNADGGFHDNSNERAFGNRFRPAGSRSAAELVPPPH